MMRSNRGKQTVEVPQSLTDAEVEQSRIARDRDKNAITSDVYRGKANGDDVVVALKELYHNKCAYCESREHEPSVEHYRPKKRVTGTGRTPAHPGYYWLCYEWTNLLPTCHDCNKIGGGKADQFPLANENNRIMQPVMVFSADTGVDELDRSMCFAHLAPLIDEQPMLLHPEIDSPETFFEIDNNGNIRGIDANGRGERTIAICNLRRQNLLDARQNIIDDLKKDFEEGFILFLEGDLTRIGLHKKFRNAIHRSLERSNPNHCYSLVYLQCVQHFERILLPLFEADYREALQRMIAEIKAEIGAA